ncbi:hypothetical protein [Shewanella gaetbuli]
MKWTFSIAALFSFCCFSNDIQTSEGVIIDPLGNQITINYENINGYAIMEGDILLGNFYELQAKQDGTVGTMANKIIVSSKY